MKIHPNTKDSIGILIFIFLLLNLHSGASDAVPTNEEKAGGRCSWARLQFPIGYGGPNIYPYADLRLVHFLRQNTSANVDMKWNVASIDSLEEMCNYPLIFAHGQGNFSLTVRQKNNLAEYMKRGGFLFIEDCVAEGMKTDAFIAQMVIEMPSILPESTTVPLKKDHDIFKNVFKMKNGLPFTTITPELIRHGLYGVYFKGRMVALLSPSDLHCGWAGMRGPGHTRGTLEAHVLETKQLGVNIYTYIMTH